MNKSVLTFDRDEHSRNYTIKDDFSFLKCLTCVYAPTFCQINNCYVKAKCNLEKVRRSPVTSSTGMPSRKSILGIQRGKYIVFFSQKCRLRRVSMGN